MDENILGLLPAREGHFLLESGHHGSLWLDLETLCLQPGRIDVLANKLSAALSKLDIDIVCGPLVEGAFVGLMVASSLKVQFAYSERFARSSIGTLFPAGYRIPAALRNHVRGKRVVIVNDVINAGSSVRGTFEDLKVCHAEVVGIGALLVLGTAASRFATENHVPLTALCHASNNIWLPSECPLCTSGSAVEDVGNFRTTFSLSASEL